MVTFSGARGSLFFMRWKRCSCENKSESYMPKTSAREGFVAPNSYGRLCDEVGSDLFHLFFETCTFLFKECFADEVDQGNVPLKTQRVHMCG